MKSHVWRPFWVVVGIVAIILLVRYFVVPSDFGIGARGYMYGWHRAGDVQDWKDFPVSYRFKDSQADCGQCHEEKVKALASSPHVIIKCENCHGPALSHPDKPEKLAINRSRALCERCHVALPYPTSDRSKIIGIDPATHNAGVACVECHNPHHPNLEDM